MTPHAPHGQDEHPDPDEKLLMDVHAAAALLDISEDELWGLVKTHKIPTHNVAGAFLRFRKHDIEELKIKWRIERELFPRRERYFAHQSTVKKPGIGEKLRDFWYFNDFYILCSALAVLLLYFIVSS
jgi:hypothetical protein